MEKEKLIKTLEHFENEFKNATIERNIVISSIGKSKLQIISTGTLWSIQQKQSN